MIQDNDRAPILSVVITVYNIRRDWTEVSIDSILAWHHDLEIVIVDDGSTDIALLQYLQARAGDDPRVRYVRQENAGTGAARKLGVELAKGRWVTLMDPDDYMLPSESVVEALTASNDKDLILASAIGVDADGTTHRETYSVDRLGDSPSAADLATELMSIYLYGRESAAFLLGVPWAKFFRTSWLRAQDVNFDPRVVKRSDAEWLLRTFTREPRSLAIDEPVVAYRLGVGYSGAQRYREGTVAGYEVLRATAESVPGVTEQVRQLYRLELVKDGINSIFSNPHAPKNVRTRAAYRSFRRKFAVSYPLLRSKALREASLARKGLYLAIRSGSFMLVLALRSLKKVRPVGGR